MFHTTRMLVVESPTKKGKVIVSSHGVGEDERLYFLDDHVSMNKVGVSEDYLPSFEDTEKLTQSVGDRFRLTSQEIWRLHQEVMCTFNISH